MHLHLFNQKQKKKLQIIWCDLKLLMILLILYEIKSKKKILLNFIYLQKKKKIYQLFIVQELLLEFIEQMLVYMQVKIKLKRN